jgi:plasmid stabilization system protein ParE
MQMRLTTVIRQEVIMPRAAWSKKRERQYQHIKASLNKRGAAEEVAEEIAARTVNKERAQHGESRTASLSTLKDMPAPRQGGLRSHSGAGGRTYQQLYAEAISRNIKGRSGITRRRWKSAGQ